MPSQVPTIADAAPQAQVDRRPLIDSRPVTAAKTFASINPATGEVIGHAPDAGVEEAEAAIAAARRAFDSTRIRTGSFSINGGNYFGADSPFGGFKQSGVGREMGVAGLEEFLERRTFAVPALGGMA
jgi:aldehyde dehydrogenase (NAD+)